MKFVYDLSLVFDAAREALFGLAAKAGLPWEVPTLVTKVVTASILFGFVNLSAIFLVWWERKISAHMQSRLGPMRVGWHGILQTIADGMKLLQKEDIVPAEADKIAHFCAPLVVIVGAVLAYVVIPFGPRLWAADLNVGVLYVFAVTGLGVIGILMAGWGSNNKYSLLGGLRAAAQLLSYEIPMVVSVLGVVLIAGTLSLTKVVEAQSRAWFIFYQPVGFFIFFLCSLAEANRAPFDLAEAESELTGGFHTEYSGLKFSMFFLAEYPAMFTGAAMGTTLFLGGWRGPFLPPWMWFLIKCYGLIFVMMWFRWTFPRFRIDQLLSFCWKFLLPLSFVNLLVTGLAVLL